MGVSPALAPTKPFSARTFEPELHLKLGLVAWEDPVSCRVGGPTASRGLPGASVCVLAALQALPTTPVVHSLEMLGTS